MLPALLAKPLVLTVFAVAAFGLYMSNATPPTASLAGDVGVADVDACAAVREHALWVVPNLDASGFPHATTDPVEHYRLTRAGEVEAFVAIDWVNRNAYCLPLDPATPYTVSFDMTTRAYNALATELANVITTGHLSDQKVVNGFHVSTGTAVTRPDGTDDWDYKVTLGKWAAGKIAQAQEAGA